MATSRYLPLGGRYQRGRVGCSALLSEGRDTQPGWTQGEGCPSRAGNTVGKELRQSWVVDSSCCDLRVILH